MRYIITAAYADDHLSDGPQVYETTVDADSVEEAEKAAQEQCIADNQWEDSEWECNYGANGQSRTPGPLVDIYARPELEDPLMEGIVQAMIARGHDETYVRQRMEIVGDALKYEIVAPMLDKLEPNFERIG